MCVCVWRCLTNTPAPQRKSFPRSGINQQKLHSCQNLLHQNRATQGLPNGHRPLTEHTKQTHMNLATSVSVDTLNTQMDKTTHSIK